MTVLGNVSAQPPSENGDIETNGIEISPLQFQIGSIAELYTNIYANDLGGGYCWPVGSILVIVSLPDEGIEFDSWKSPINGAGVGPYFNWTYDAGTKTITGINHTAMCDGDQEIPYFNVKGAATAENKYLTCSQIVLNIMNNPDGPIWGYNDPANDNGITGFVIEPKDEGSTVSCWADAIEPDWSFYFKSACAAPSVSYTDVGTCEGTRTYTFTFANCNAWCFPNSSFDWTYTYTIDMPDFTPATDGGSTVNCPANALVAPSTPLVNDACGKQITPTLKTQPTAITCEGTMVWVYTYTDCTGSSHDWTYTYTISLPALVIPADGESTVACSDLAVQPIPPSISDACGNTITPNVGTSPAATCNGDMVWEFTYTDCASRSNVWTYTYHVNDNVLPVITRTGNATEYVCLGDTYTDAGATASDNCSGDLTSSIAIVNPVNTSVAGTYTVTYSVTDNCGNAAVEVNRTVVVRAQLGGTISGTITIPQNGQNPGVITFTGSNGMGSYTFAYTVQHDSGPINSYTVSGNPTVTVIQPNNDLGVFTYTLISITDANGCTRTFDDPKPTAVVTVVQACDLQLSLLKPSNLDYSRNQQKDGVVRLLNYGPGSTVGQLTFRVTKVTNFEIEFYTLSATYAGLACDNSLFDIFDDGVSYRLVAKSPLTSISANGYLQFGFRSKAIGALGATGNMTASINVGTGGDSNGSNNRIIANFSTN